MPTAAAFTMVLALGVSSLLWLGATRTGRPRDAAFAIGFAALVLLASGFFAWRGALEDFSLNPPPILRLLLPTTVATLLLGLSPFGMRLARAVPLWALVGFQSFRVAVEILLWALHRAGALPVQMTFEGGNVDILTGVWALVLGWALRSTSARSVPIGWVWAWNALGLTTLLNIVVIAVLSMPTALRVFHAEPANTLVATFPFVWIPCVFVQAALLGHVLTFRALRRPALSPSLSPG